MSGTSADGIDAALVQIEGEGRSVRVQLRHFLCVPHAPAMRDAILRACIPDGGHAPDLCALDSALGERFAEAARALAESCAVPLRSVDAIASHGQTVWHQPDSVEIGGVKARGTLQLGNAAIIAARTGCQVVSDFRSADMAAGGQGAPLVPYFDWAVLTSDAESRAVVNIGGIANVTHLPRSARIDDVLAFDTGPGNMIIDEAVRRLSGGTIQYDEGGEWAFQERPELYSVVKILRDHTYFNQPPPKSTGREMFGAAFVDKQWPGLGSHRADAPRVLATITNLVSESILNQIRSWILPRGDVQNIIVSGGGVHNKLLMGLLAVRADPCKVTTVENYGIPVDSKEAMAFALLGYETLHGRPSNVPSATGASRPTVLGSITPKP